ncbi:hypothetical protein A3D88_03995 [Candidatus Peribacteria bacterium RIFCSPHIGHO2_02_FULL_52_16]|nr:MAG: hypothetical protein A2706_05275 [Candidatus Peribacteria bacterium RIFCSPHIGHO2_01_FULL_51_35]OGJ61881.1 MAG: hypothetical protein A3D88_03995 [Candidatus Peribacteria bacterium RIFCSPHIGHO2_02_FULL_52_16]
MAKRSKEAQADKSKEVLVKDFDTLNYSFGLVGTFTRLAHLEPENFTRENLEALLNGTQNWGGHISVNDKEVTSVILCPETMNEIYMDKLREQFLETTRIEDDWGH